MTQGSTILIDPVTRIEGHSKITLHLDMTAASRTRVFTSHNFAVLRSCAMGVRFTRCHRSWRGSAASARSAISSRPRKLVTLCLR